MQSERDGRLATGSAASAAPADAEPAETTPVVTVLGGVATRLDGSKHRLPPAQRHLLAVLVAAGPDGLSADRLADELWSEAPPAQWASSLRMAVSRLRKRLPPGALPAGDGTYRLDLAVTEVDAWQLQILAEDDSLAIDQGKHIPLLRATAPFGDTELSPLVQMAAQRVSSHRVVCFERILASGEEPNAFVCDELRAHAMRDLLDETMVLLSATADMSAQRPQRALKTIRAAEQVLQEDLGASLGPALQRLADDLEVGTNPDFRARQQSFPSGLERELAHPLVGRERLLEKLLALSPRTTDDTDRILLITGPSGVGKSRLAAAVAKALHDDGANVRFSEAEPNSDVAYAPFATISETTFAAIAEAVAETGDPAHQTSMIWSRALKIVEGARARPFVAIIEDAHWLDSPSRDLLLFLARVPTRAQLSFIIVGSDDVEDTNWHEFRQALSESERVTTVDVPPYDRDALAALVDHRLGPYPAKDRARLTDEIAEMSGGNPAIADALLNSVDKATLELNRRSFANPDRPLVDLVESLTIETRVIGSAAAVLGPRFRLDQLTQLLDIEQNKILDGLQELSDRRLIRETEEPFQFQFRNYLLQRAVETSILDARRRHLHLAAAALTSSLHQRAAHLVAAAPAADPAETVEALCASARRHLDEGNSGDAVRAIDRAREFDEVPLPSSTLVLYSEALEVTGATMAAAEIRAQAFEQAWLAQDWSGAVDAALSGLPAAERGEGDPERVAMLEKIPLERLDQDRAFTLALARSRQHFILGNLDDTDRWSEVAEATARGPVQRLQAASQKWLRSRHSTGDPRSAVWDTSVEVDSLPSELRISAIHPLVIEAIERGDTSEAADRLERLGRVAEELHDPVGQWSHLLLVATLHFQAGDHDAGHASALAANQLGFVYGITNAPSAYMAQVWFAEWLLDRHGNLAPTFSAADEQLFSTDLARAARASSRYAAGDTNRAVAEAEELMAQYRQVGCPFGPCVPVILLDLIEAMADPDLLNWTIETLRRWGGHMPVVANGLAVLGPVDYHLSRLVPDEREAAELRRSALALAKRAGSRPWIDVLSSHRPRRQELLLVANQGTMKGAHDPHAIATQPGADDG